MPKNPVNVFIAKIEAAINEAGTDKKRPLTYAEILGALALVHHNTAESALKAHKVEQAKQQKAPTGPPDYRQWPQRN